MSRRRLTMTILLELRAVGENFRRWLARPSPDVQALVGLGAKFAVGGERQEYNRRASPGVAFGSPREVIKRPDACSDVRCLAADAPSSKLALPRARRRPVRLISPRHR